MSKNKKENKLWKWDRTKIILKDPNDNDVVLSSLNLNDVTCEHIFQDIEEYVQKEGGKLE
jgi:hypothetical protein